MTYQFTDEDKKIIEMIPKHIIPSFRYFARETPLKPVLNCVERIHHQFATKKSLRTGTWYSNGIGGSSYQLSECNYEWRLTAKPPGGKEITQICFSVSSGLTVSVRRHYKKQSPLLMYESKTGTWKFSVDEYHMPSPFGAPKNQIIDVTELVNAFRGEVDTFESSLLWMQLEMMGND